MEVDVIIVNYRTAQLAVSSISSILDHGVAAIDRIIVVDNASGDDSVEQILHAFPNIQLIASEVNAGFGAGINLGLKRATAKYVLVLNPDTYFEENAISPVISLMEQQADIGVIGLDLVNPDGSRQYSARRFYSLLDIMARRVGVLGRLLSSRIDRHMMKDAWSSGAPFDAEWVMGTGFVIQRGLFNDLKGMDERYFLYMEDVDLCARIWSAGYRVVCIPNAKLVHCHQRSSAASVLSAAGRRHLASLMLFAKNFQLPLVRQPGVEVIVRSFRSANRARQ